MKGDVFTLYFDAKNIEKKGKVVMKFFTRRNIAKILVCVMTFSMTQGVYADELGTSEAASDICIDDTDSDQSSTSASTSDNSDDSDSSTEPSLTDGENSGNDESSDDSESSEGLIDELPSTPEDETMNSGNDESLTDSDSSTEISTETDSGTSEEPETKVELDSSTEITPPHFDEEDSGNDDSLNGSAGGSAGGTAMNKESAEDSQTNYTYELGDSATITVIPCDGTMLPNGVDFHVEPFTEDSPETNEAIEIARTSFKLKDSDNLYFLPYDMYFTDEDGAKVEPAGDMSVAIEYSEDPFAGDFKDGKSEIFALHMSDDGTVEKLDMTYEKIDSGAKFTFVVSSLSIIGPAMVVTALKPIQDGQYMNVYVPSVPSEVDGAAAKTLEDAFACLADGGTVWLTDNVSMDSVTMDNMTGTLKSYNDTCTVTKSGESENMFNLSNSSLTLENVIIDASDNSLGRTITASDNSELILNDKAVLENNITHGAIYSDGSSIQMNGGTIRNNHAEQGGAIYANSANIEITDGVFSNNSVTLAGGAIWYRTTKPDSVVNISNTKFEENQSVISDDNTTPLSNYSNVLGQGGSFYIISGDEGTLSVTFTDCEFIRNTATADGGALYCTMMDDSQGKGSALTLANCSFSENTAKNGDGGAVSLRNIDTLTVQNCTISENSAQGNGGGLCVYNDAPYLSTTSIDGGYFTGNLSKGSGGGLEYRTCQSDVTIQGGAVFSDNTAWVNSGAMGFYHIGDVDDTDEEAAINVHLISCDVNNNTCTGEGQSTVSNQQSEINCSTGGIYIDEGVSAHTGNMLITHNVVEDTEDVAGNGITLGPNADVSISSESKITVYENGDSPDDMDIMAIPPLRLYLGATSGDGRAYNWTDQDGEAVHAGKYNLDSTSNSVSTLSDIDDSSSEPIGFKANISDVTVTSAALTATIASISDDDTDYTESDDDTDYTSNYTVRITDNTSASTSSQGETVYSSGGMSINGSLSAEPMPIATGGPYALLFSDGALIFTNTYRSSDTTHGSLVASYTGWDTSISASAPWRSNASKLKIVSFENKFAPVSTAYWFYNCDNLASFDGVNLDTSKVTNMSYMFYNCSSLKTLNLSSWNTQRVTNMSYMFRNCSSLATLNLSTWNTQSVINMSSMFGSCSNLTTLTGVSTWNTQSVTNMSSMFTGCSQLTVLTGISTWDTQSVTTMSNMFYYCDSLKTLDLSTWNTQRVTNMSYMFRNCSSLATLNLSTWNTQSVINMSSMFEDCSSLTTLTGISTWDTKNVTDMSSVFSGCSVLTTFNLSGWDTQSVTNMSNMFSYCLNLITLDLSDWKTQSVTSMSSMFNYCSSLTTLDLSNWNTQSITGMNYMFSDCSSLTTIYANDWTGNSKVNSASNVFYKCTKLPDFSSSNVNGGMCKPRSQGGYFYSTAYALLFSDGTLAFTYNYRTSDPIHGTLVGSYTGWDTATYGHVNNVPWSSNGSQIKSVIFENKFAPKSTANWFCGCSNLASFDSTNLDTTNVENTYYMFCDCSSLINIDLSNWKTDKVINMDAMFRGCSKLRDIVGIGSWNVSKVTNMHDFICGCSSITALDLSKWKPSSVTTFNCTFKGCSQLKTLGDIKSWDVSSVTVLGGMFYGCSSLTTLDLSNWDVSKVTRLEDMFEYSNKLTTLDLSNWNTTSVSNISNMFRGCSNLKKIYGNDWTGNSSIKSTSGVFSSCTSLRNYSKTDGSMCKPVTLGGYFVGPSGNLSVSKTVTGNGGDTSKYFNFTVTLNNTYINGLYGDMNFTNGKATFTLKHGEKKTAEEIPEGLTYTVSEAEDGKDGYTTTVSNTSGTITSGSTKAATFTNKRLAGSLTVKKTVTGNGGDTSKYFNFTVTLDDKTVNGTYGGMTFTNGVAKFSLKNGETKTASNLTAGTTYTVAETEANIGGYTTTSTNSSGKIPENSTITATFTNNRLVGNLSVTKTVTGSGGDTSKNFSFTVTLSDKTVNGDYGDMNFVNGVANFNLRHGETKTAKSLLKGITYTVVEKEANADGYTTTSRNASGSIPENSTAATTFTNNRLAGNLSVTKTVTGTGGDKSRNFNFTITLSDKTVNGSYGDMNFVNGVANFTLKHGETKTAKNLLAGITYTVTEKEANTDGYTTTYANDTGKITDSITSAAVFTNYKMLPVSLPITGGSGTLPIVSTSILLYLVGVVIIILMEKPKSKRKINYRI